MRTTVTLDDQLFKELKALAAETRAPFKQVVNRALREGIRTLRHAPRPKPYRTKTFRMGRLAGVNLDKARALVAHLDDEEVARKLALRK